jgi:uncharacterized repeat protein (TIGR03803 family)
MKRFGLGRYALIGGVAVALLAACGGSQPPVAPSPLALHRSVPSGTYNQLYRFHARIDGTQPGAGLLNVNGALYGTTTRGGISGHGTIFSISTAGVYKVLYRFRGSSDGSDPQAGLIDLDGTLYGTTHYGGSSNFGTVYAVTPSGSERVLYSFHGGSDGNYPVAGLTVLSGRLYGTTSAGGGHACNSGGSPSSCGTVFSLTRGGVEKVLHAFTGPPDGAYPDAEVTEVKGILYGTTVDGGRCPYYECGTVYSVTTSGSEKVVYSFGGSGSTDGSQPSSRLIYVNGLLYGTTTEGGTYIDGCGTNNPCGTVFGVSTKGSEKIIHSFAGGSDGGRPEAGLVDVNGILYGTTSIGGANRCYGGCGTVYSITTAGVKKVLYSFAGGTDGSFPASVLTDLDGTLYGTTPLGGYHDKSYGLGTIFTVTPQ